ncbi:hypothetical protein [Dyadobacter sp. SG02]|uniref:hypothetical protein n=1 Tax=Dyadobacter sp. SG02 TaxID=1855291 RepID=UPI00115FC6E3|nr:hypothetical protein [Dyadobacter sp. SG02]
MKILCEDFHIVLTGACEDGFEIANPLHPERFSCHMDAPHPGVFSFCFELKTDPVTHYIWVIFPDPKELDIGEFRAGADEYI